MGEFSLLAKRLFRRRVVLLAALLLLAIVGTALVLPPLLGIDPNAINVLERLQAPSGKHWAGTDELGRDLGMRIVWGGRYSILIGVVTACCSVLLGTALGLVAGFFRRLDAPIMRVIDAMMAFDPADAFPQIADIGFDPGNARVGIIEPGFGNRHLGQDVAHLAKLILDAGHIFFQARNCAAK